MGAAASVSEARRVPAEQDYRPSSRLPSLPADELDPVGPVFELPQRRARRPIGGFVSFVVCVLLPTIVAAVYYFGYASNQYVVEWRYAVRDTSTAASTSAAASGLTALLGVSTTATGPENYMVAEYLTSRQAAEDLDARIGVRKLYARPFVDALSRFDDSQPMEQFAKYWQYMVTAAFDQITGTAIAQVRAFTPEDAYRIATTLIALSEDLVNDEAQRPQREAVRYAEAEVRRGEERLKAIRAEMTEYRNKEALIDPTNSVVLSNATLASNLRALLVQYQTELTAMQKGGLGPGATQVQTMKLRINAVQDQLKDVESMVSTVKQGDRSLSEIVARYEQLDLERQFAQNMVISTMQSLEQARSNAMAKRIFISAYVHPSMPQSSSAPNRLVAVLTVAGASFLIWTVALLLARSIREHAA